MNAGLSKWPPEAPCTFDFLGRPFWGGNQQPLRKQVQCRILLHVLLVFMLSHEHISRKQPPPPKKKKRNKHQTSTTSKKAPRVSEAPPTNKGPPLRPGSTGEPKISKDKEQPTGSALFSLILYMSLGPRQRCRKQDLWKVSDGNYRTKGRHRLLIHWRLLPFNLSLPG